MRGYSATSADMLRIYGGLRGVLGEEEAPNVTFSFLVSCAGFMCWFYSALRSFLFVLSLCSFFRTCLGQTIGTALYNRKTIGSIGKSSESIGK